MELVHAVDNVASSSSVPPLATNVAAMTMTIVIDRAAVDCLFEPCDQGVKMMEEMEI